MTAMTDPPVWLASAVALLAVAGAALTLVGSIGLLRFRRFFQRIHAPTLGTTLGAGAILIASMLFFSTVESRPVLGELLIAAFLIVTTPISFIVLAMATRSRTEPTTPSDPTEKADRQPVPASRSAQSGKATERK
jgi:multicomponent K+:H+ antiporter subunit G